MTKITILGSEATEKKELKKIEFVRNLNDVHKPDFPPNKYNNIMLIKKNFINGYDFMLAWNNSCSTRGCILGHFNDGVV